MNQCVRVRASLSLSIYLTCFFLEKNTRHYQRLFDLLQAKLAQNGNTLCWPWYFSDALVSKSGYLAEKRLSLRIQRVWLQLTYEGAPGDPPADLRSIVLGYLRNVEGLYRQINTAKAVHIGIEQAAAQICADPRAEADRNVAQLSE